MPEVYKVKSPCDVIPPGPLPPPGKIDMPVEKVGSPPSPVTRIVAWLGSSTSWEREALPRYSDIYFNSNQFTMLKTYVNTATKLYVAYDAPALIPGDDRIYSPTVSLNFP